MHTELTLPTGTTLMLEANQWPWRTVAPRAGISVGVVHGRDMMRTLTGMASYKKGSSLF
jgi:hypothetical protein